MLVELSVKNLSAAPMPVMLGVHPYFPDAAGAQLQATLPRVYTPAGRGFFCVEPQSAAPGALERNAAEATVVPPGVRFAIRVHFTVGAS